MTICLCITVGKYVTVTIGNTGKGFGFIPVRAFVSVIRILHTNE